MRVISSTVLLLAVLHAPLTAQNALVLSGGGARGLAHIGVIEYLTEHSYDADLVVGTSMGAVVGALYAAGYTTEEIKERVLGIRWSELFDATPVVVGPARTLHVPAFNMAIDVGNLRAGLGLFGQWRVNRALANLLFEANARSQGDFDALPHRYRAVAADLRTGRPVVLDHGDLARAVRASMAYPGFFAPVRWDDYVLTDGGIVENFPVASARELGASHIIGVNVSRPSEQLSTRSPLSVIDRTLRLMQQNLERNAAPDAAVTPIISQDFVGPSFPEDSRPLIRLGYDAAQRDLAHVSLPTRATNGRARPQLPRRFSELRIEAPDTALAALARHVFSKIAVQDYDPAGVSTAIDRLYSTGLFEGVWPRVLPAGDTSQPPVLVVRVEAPPRVSLSGNAHFENDRGGRVWLSLDKQDRIGTLPTMFSVAGTAGSLERWATASMRIHMRTRSAFAWSAGAHVLESGVRFFQDDALTTTELFRAGGWIGWEWPHILRARLLTVTGRADWIDTEGNDTSGWAVGPVIRYSAVAAQARPVGWPLLVEVEHRWGSQGYSRAQLRASHVFGKRRTLLALGIDLRGVSADAPIDVLPSLGDEHAIPGLRWGELRGQARAVTGADLAVPVQPGYLRLRTRIGAVSDELDDWQHTHWEKGAELGFFMRTPIGVIEVGYGIATRGDGRFDVSLGRNF